MSILLDCLRKKPDLPEIQKIITQNPDSICYEDVSGDCALHEAVYWCNKADVIKFLIQLSPKLLWKEEINGDYPIHVALEKNPNPNIIKIFIDNMGISDISKIKHRSNKSLLHFAARNSHLGVFGIIFNLDPQAIYHKDDQGLLPNFYAIWETNMGYSNYCHILPILKKLINPKIASICTPRTGNLPLHLIVDRISIYDKERSYLPLVKWIFTQNPGAILKKNFDGKTPLDIARKKIAWYPNCIHLHSVVDFLEQETDRIKNNAATKVSDDTLVKVFECPICLEECSSAQIELECCKKEVCSACLARWIPYGGSAYKGCPLCRTPVNRHGEIKDSKTLCYKIISRMGQMSL